MCQSRQGKGVTKDKTSNGLKAKHRARGRCKKIYKINNWRSTIRLLPIRHSLVRTNVVQPASQQYRSAQIVTSPSCSVTSFTSGSFCAAPSSALLAFSAASSALFALAAAAKLNVGLTFAAAVATLGEAGTEALPLTLAGGDLGVWPRSTPVREVVRDTGAWVARSLIASRSFSSRSATAFSLAVTSTGLWKEKGTAVRIVPIAGYLLGHTWQHQRDLIDGRCSQWHSAFWVKRAGRMRLKARRNGGGARASDDPSEE